MKVGTLEAIIPGQRRLVLCALFTEVDRWWTVGQLARRVALPERSVRQHLAVLGCGGVVRSRRTDRVTAYQPDPGCPVFPELRSMLRTAGAGDSPTVLVVEDQEATAQITRILLESWGYRVLEAHGPSQATEMFDREPDRVSLLVADVKMPGMSGPQLALRLVQRKPELGIIFMSGEPPAGPLCERAAFLEKPFTPATLARAVRRQLAHMKAS